VHNIFQKRTHTERRFAELLSRWPSASLCSVARGTLPAGSVSC